MLWRKWWGFSDNELKGFQIIKKFLSQDMPFSLRLYISQDGVGYAAVTADHKNLCGLSMYLNRGYFSLYIIKYPVWVVWWSFVCHSYLEIQSEGDSVSTHASLITKAKKDGIVTCALALKGFCLEMSSVLIWLATKSYRTWLYVILKKAVMYYSFPCAWK